MVPLPRASGGLKKDSVALCHQVTTLDRAKLTEPLGRLSHELLQMVDAALKAALDLEWTRAVGTGPRRMHETVGKDHPS